MTKKNNILEKLGVVEPVKEEPVVQPQQVSNTQIVRRFYLPGQMYSSNKAKIKELMKKHYLKWVGSMDYPKWENTQSRLVIKAEFLRENGVTVGASLTYEGTAQNKFIIEFTYYLDKIGSEYTDDVLEVEELPDDELDKMVDKELETWDIFNRPNVEAMRRGEPNARRPPAPERFIELAVADWKSRRKDKAEEIRQRIKEEGK